MPAREGDDLGDDAGRSTRSSIVVSTSSALSIFSDWYGRVKKKSNDIADDDRGERTAPRAYRRRRRTPRRARTPTPRWRWRDRRGTARGCRRRGEGRRRRSRARRPRGVSSGSRSCVASCLRYTPRRRRSEHPRGVKVPASRASRTRQGPFAVADGCERCTTGGRHGRSSGVIVVGARRSSRLCVALRVRVRPDHRSRRRLRLSTTPRAPRRCPAEVVGR